MQDERDCRRDEDYHSLKQDYERIKEEKVTMQRSLQENIEEMMDLKQERERAADRIGLLEAELHEKELDLERMRRESSEKSERITTLEHRLEEKTKEVGIVTSQLKASERSVNVMKMELERSTNEIEDLRCKIASWDDVASAKPGRMSLLGWKRNSVKGGEEGGMDTFDEQLRERDMQIESLDKSLKANEATINSLKSDMVKMSSTYKQEDYLKRKQIAKLKQDNAEYALKLRALEMAFKSVNEEISMHGSMHSARATNKDDRAEAVKTRLGGIASHKESLIDGSDSSLDSRKREDTEEC